MSHTVLIVDGDPLFCLHLKFSLQEVGFVVYTAQNEQEAVKLLTRVAVNLLLVDIMLLEPNGAMSCWVLRTMCSVPIIVMASSRSPEDILVTFAAGVDDCITKPFALAAVTARIQMQLKATRFPIYSNYAFYLNEGETRTGEYPCSTCRWQAPDC